MPSVRVAVVQFDAKPENVAGNRDKMVELARRARESGARWILFHESAISDYSQRIDRFAETVPGGESTASFIKLARELDCIISFGLSEVENDRYFISQVFVGPQGLLHRYRKTWIWTEPSDRGFRNEWARYDPGTGPEAFEVDGVRATCFICSDGEAPRCVARARGLHPEVVFYPNNAAPCPSLTNWERWLANWIHPCSLPTASACPGQLLQRRQRRLRSRRKRVGNGEPRRSGGDPAAQSGPSASKPFLRAILSPASAAQGECMEGS